MEPAKQLEEPPRQPVTWVAWKDIWSTEEKPPKGTPPEQKKGPSLETLEGQRESTDQAKETPLVSSVLGVRDRNGALVTVAPVPTSLR